MRLPPLSTPPWGHSMGGQLLPPGPAVGQQQVPVSHGARLAKAKQSPQLVPPRPLWPAPQQRPWTPGLPRSS